MLVAALALAGCGSSARKTVTVTSTGTVAAPTSTTATTGSRSAPSTSSTTTTSTSSTTTTTATTALPPPAPRVHLATFKSPSANIGCMIIAGTARCDIKQRAWTPPARPTACPTEVDFGQGLIVTGSGAGHFVCAGDTTLDPSAAVLPYGSDTAVGSFRCQSRTAGLTCVNARTTHGFFISIQSYRAF